MRLVVLAAATLACLLAVAREALDDRADAQERSSRADDAAITAALDSPEACARALARSAPHDGPPRLATWNVRWFPDGRANGRLTEEGGTDVPYLACAIAALRVDVLAVQEFLLDARGRAALASLLADLEARTGERWEARFDECPGDGRQHVGILYRTRRVEVEEVRVLPEVNPGPSACSHQLRPGLLLRGRVGGVPMDVITVHLDSGTTARDFDHRALSYERLAARARRAEAASTERALVLLGDFNTMGCEACSPPRTASEEIRALEALFSEPAIALARAEVEAACTERYGAQGAILDHAFVRGAVARARVVGPCATTCGRASARHPLFRRLSDHCPLVVELGIEPIAAP